MTRRDLIFAGCIVALGLWITHLSSELSATSVRLDNTMETLMDLRIDLWDKHHLGPNDPDPLDLFRDKNDDKGQDPLGLFPYLKKQK